MNASASTTRSRTWTGLIVLGLAAALVALYFWPKAADRQAQDAANATLNDASVAGTAAGSPNGPLPPGAVSNVGGIPLDANGDRILNSAGLPISNEPLPEAKAIPIKAPAGTVIGYTKDAQGNSKPLVAGDLKQIPNTPGSFAVVDMWADGGPTVVPPTQGKHLTEAELKRLQDAERAREKAGSNQP